MDRHADSFLASEDRERSGRSRYLAAASVVVAAFAFMITTVVWRLVQQSAAVEAAVHEGIAGVRRLAASNSDELAGLREAITGQAAAAEAIERRLASVETAGRAGADHLEDLRRDVERASQAFSQARQEMLERMAVDSDRQATARDALSREVNAALGRVERTLLAQAEDYQVQRRHLDAASERDRAARRAMLQEATQAFAVQVDGLRQLLDSLRVEAESVAGTAAAAPGLEDAAVGAAPEPVADKAAAELPTRGDAAEDQRESRDGEAATAALGKEGVLE